MTFLESREIDTDKWDALVDRTEGASVFSYSWYLDAVAENWAVLVNDDYSSGVALPYSIRLGHKILYTPIFCSYLECLGEMNVELLSEQIHTLFKTGDINFLQKVLGEPNEIFVCQNVGNEQFRLGSQAKRAMKKADKADFKISQVHDNKDIVEIIEKELVDKVHAIDKQTFPRLSKAIRNGQNRGKLINFELKEGESKLLGGLVCIQKPGILLYLKGAAVESGKNEGGMFLLMNTAINYAFEQGLLFDFGGSRVPGVRKFNQHFGGQDFEFYNYTFNKGPWWFKILRSIHHRWFKK